MKPILAESFIVLQIIGLWKPEKNVSPCYNWFYNLRMCLIFFFIYSFTINGFIGLIISSKSISDLSNDCFILLSILAICGKIVNIVNSRQQIIEIIKVLDCEPCKPRNKDEELIQIKVDRIIRFNTLFYGILTEITAFMVTVGTLLQRLPIGVLPYNTYIPWDYSKGSLYWLAYIYQIISVGFSANSDIGYDTLIPGLMMQISAKVQILKYRFLNLVNSIESTQGDKYYLKSLKLERKIIADSVKCHLVIFKLAETINSTFSSVIFLQFIISSIVLCISVYNMARMPLFSTEFTTIVLYLCCMLTEIFILCAAGNEVTLVSRTVSDAIYHMDWMSLDSTTVKSLIIIMNRSLRPIKFISGNLVVLSYDSFKALIKTSYSAFNVLQQT
ncbi:odorant receptor 46a-like [Chelonus insularis]|uniref:odorant receptor 46a-like n=1 Tax=Chelonus insularis TaxID=460826 RepID=UPI00158A80F4|nr:odorant receptor 46a-like [Chelonus insularis]